MKIFSKSGFNDYVKNNNMIVRTFGSNRIGGDKYYWELFDNAYLEYKKVVPKLPQVELDYEIFGIIHNTIRSALKLDKIKFALQKGDEQ